VKNIFKNRKQILEGIKNNIFKKKHIEDIAEERFSICKNCSFFDTNGKNCTVLGTQPCCSLCGCSLKLKTRSLSSACPESKWLPIMDKDLETKLKNKLNSDDTA
tara:strand:+ start:319 stop:630 length:312 start_codon:yes stop_codon:yes gene_type:complete